MAQPGSAAGPVGQASGFWRLERPAGKNRTWLFDPHGNAAFMLGVNAVMRHGGSVVAAGIDDYIRRDDPSRTARIEWARLSDGDCGDQHNDKPYGFNSVAAFSETNDFDASGGDSFMVRAPDDGAGAPYAVVLNIQARGEDRALKDHSGVPLKAGFSEHAVGDPFNPLYVQDLEAIVAREVTPRRADPRLQMWFAGNEIGIFDIAKHVGDDLALVRKGSFGGVRDFRRWIWSDVPSGSTIDRPRCARHALAAFLRERYHSSIADLNSAWESSYASFSAIVGGGPHPVPHVQHCNERAGVDLQCFVHDRLLREWVHVVTKTIRGADPNHLIASPRLAIADPRLYRFWSGRDQPQPDRWADSPAIEIGTDSAAVRYSPFDLFKRDGRAGFDLVAINVYTGAAVFPRAWLSDGLHKIQGQSGLPVVISEFGIRARIEHWSNKGGAAAFVPPADPDTDQQLRGQRYGSQIDQFIGFRDVVGACWHAWSDRFDAARKEHQINLGLIKCTAAKNAMKAGDRWEPVDALIAQTNRDIMRLIAAKTGH